jgi:hypothetical protein
MHTPIPFLPQQPYDQKGQGVKPFPLELVNLIPSGQPPFEEWELPLRCQMMQSVVTQDPKPGFPTVAGDPKFRPLVCKERNHLNLEAHDDANSSRSSNDHATQATQRSGIDPVPELSRCDQHQQYRSSPQTKPCTLSWRKNLLKTTTSK